MSIQQLADDTTKEVLESLSGNTENSEGVSSIIQKALLKAIGDMRTGSVDAVNICCSADQDLAHKIADGIRKKEELLISNLMSLR